GASWGDRRAVHDPVSVDQAVRQHRSLPAHREQLLGYRNRLAVPLGRRPVDSAESARIPLRRSRGGISAFLRDFSVSLAYRGRMAWTARARRGALLLGVLLAACACATPVGVNRVDTETMYRGLTANVLSTGQPSLYSEQLLVRLGLSRRFDDEPEAVLAGVSGARLWLSPGDFFSPAGLSVFPSGKERQPQYFLPPSR